MKIIKTSRYQRDLQRKIIKKNLKKESDTISKIERLLINSDNMQTLLNNPLSKVYRIRQKKGSLKEFFTADINQKIRMHIKPVGTYPYTLEEILEIELTEIDDKHYGDG